MISSVVRHGPSDGVFVEPLSAQCLSETWCSLWIWWRCSMFREISRCYSGLHMFERTLMHCLGYERVPTCFGSYSVDIEVCTCLSELWCSFWIWWCCSMFREIFSCYCGLYSVHVWKNTNVLFWIWTCSNMFRELFRCCRCLHMFFWLVSIRFPSVEKTLLSIMWKYSNCKCI